MTIHLLVDDAVLRSDTGGWAVKRLSDVLALRRIDIVDGSCACSDDCIRIQISFTPDAASRQELDVSDPGRPHDPESFSIALSEGRTLISVVGADERGLSYGVLELADIVEHSEDPVQGLQEQAGGIYRPTTAVRSVLRTMCSDVQDLSWFHDRGFWESYLTHLATHRVNRLHLALGMQYNYSHDEDVQDNYFVFAYPFLVDVQGYDVNVNGISAAERANNLASLRFVSDEARRRGIHFQIGLWNHAYEFPDSPNIKYKISGITPENHANYCRDALRTLLDMCPSIDGVTVRMHYEGGVHEPAHEFWSVVLGGVSQVDRTVEIDMHSKGVDGRIMDSARKSGAPLTISAKYWAEHWGLPYHQAAVREMENARPPAGGLSGVTRNERRFTRYGFGDFLDENRDYQFLFRIWPGTQRLLLWGDAEQVAGIAKSTSNLGAEGVELCEPLSFRGRKTTGTPGGREIYADPELQLSGDPWEKYAYTYRLWGRLLYNPDALPVEWLRYLNSVYGSAANHLEVSIRAASKILPLVTTFHAPSASNNFYWPEMYVNMPLANNGKSELYAFDTPEGGTLGAVTAFDPELFCTIDETADELWSGRRSGRYTAVDVSGWLDRLVEEAEGRLAAAVAKSARAGEAAFRRTCLDISILAGLGRFFAAKTKAGVAYSLYQRTFEKAHLALAVETYRTARDAFGMVADLAKGSYLPDLAFGDRVSERGHWVDRFAAIEEDLADLEAELEAVGGPGASGYVHTLAPSRYRTALEYSMPASFRPGQPIPIRVTTEDDFDCRVDLHFRHLNQGERWMKIPMKSNGYLHEASVPDGYSQSRYALQIYFTVHNTLNDAWMVPGLNEDLSNQPYHVLIPNLTDALENMDYEVQKE